MSLRFVPCFVSKESAHRVLSGGSGVGTVAHVNIDCVATVRADGDLTMVATAGHFGLDGVTNLYWPGAVEEFLKVFGRKD